MKILKCILLKLLLNFHFIIYKKVLGLSFGPRELSFENQRKNNHPRLEFVDRVRINQVGIPVMDIDNPIADFKFRGKNKHWEKKLKPDSRFNAKIIWIEFY